MTRCVKYDFNTLRQNCQALSGFFEKKGGAARQEDGLDVTFSLLARPAGCLFSASNLNFLTRAIYNTQN
jgi:hypothetical protein